MVGAGVADGRALAVAALGLGQGLQQALAPHGLGEVVHGVEFEGAHGMVGMGGHKHHGGRVGQGLHGVGQAQAILAGHVDVQQHQVEGPPARGGELRQGLARVGGFGHGGAHGVLAIAQQGAQSAAGQGFVVNDEDVHGLGRRGPGFGVRAQGRRAWARRGPAG